MAGNVNHKSLELSLAINTLLNKSGCTPQEKIAACKTAAANIEHNLQAAFLWKSMELAINNVSG